MLDILKMDRFKSPEGLRKKIAAIQGVIKELDAQIKKAQATITEIDTPAYHPARRKEYNQAGNSIKKHQAQKEVYLAEVKKLNDLIELKEAKQAAQLKPAQARK